MEKLDSELVCKLAKLAGNLGESGETVGKQGFRLILSTPEKNIDVISVLNTDGLVMAIALSNDIPDDNDVYTFKEDKVLIHWDRRISKEDVETAIRNRSMN